MSSATVLVVDDDEAITEFIQAALADAGYRVLSAVDGAALQIARTEHPDMILLDIMMPVMGGAEICQRLRADPETAHIPIVAMSAHNRLATIGQAMEVNDQLPKPFHLQRLYDTVERWAAPALPAATAMAQRP